MLHWWRVNGNPVRESHPCTQESTKSTRPDGARGRMYRFWSLRHDPTGNQPTGKSKPAMTREIETTHDPTGNRNHPSSFGGAWSANSNMELATWLECPQYSLRLNYMHISSPQPDGQSDFAPSEMLKNIVKESIHFQHLSASCQYFSTFEEDLACCSPAELLLHVVHIL